MNEKKNGGRKPTTKKKKKKITFLPFKQQKKDEIIEKK
jgi:hypothetical protein